MNINSNLNNSRNKFLVINTDSIELDKITKIFTTNLNPNLWYSLKNDLKRIGLELLGTSKNILNELTDKVTRVGENLISYDDNYNSTYLMNNYSMENFDEIMDLCAESNNIYWSDEFIIFGFIDKSHKQFDIYEFHYIWKTLRKNIFGLSLNLDLNSNADKKIDLIELFDSIIYIGFKNCN